MDLPRFLEGFTSLYTTPPPGARHRVSQVELEVPLTVRMQFADLRSFLTEHASKYGFKVIQRPLDGHSCLVYGSKSLGQEGGAPIGSALCVLLMDDRTPPKQDKAGRGRGGRGSFERMPSAAHPSYVPSPASDRRVLGGLPLADSTDTPTPTHNNAHTHSVSAFVVLLAHPSEGGLPDDAERGVLEEVGRVLQRLAVYASGVWLWTRIVNPAETTLASEISQLLSMVQPLQLSTVDSRLAQLWHLDAPFQSLLEHLAFSRQGSAKLSACRQWLVLVGPGPGDDGLIMIWNLTELMNGRSEVSPVARTVSGGLEEEGVLGPCLCRCNAPLAPETISAREAVWISSVVTDVCFWLWTLLL